MSMSPVTLRAVIEAGIVFVYLLAIGTVLYGAAIPAYQTAASERLADRVLSDSVRAINDVTIETPPTDTVQVLVSVSMPSVKASGSSLICMDG